MPPTPFDRTPDPRPSPLRARLALDGFDDADEDDDAGDDREPAEHDADDPGEEDDDPDGPFAARDPNDLGDDDAELDDAFPLGDGVAERAAVVHCPYCGEPSEVAVDPGGGAHQEYVEDCPVCCRPWRVTVAYRDDGSADVWAQTDDE